MSRTRILATFVLAVAGLARSPAPSAQAPASSPGAQDVPDIQLPAQPQPTFRGGIDFVAVDVIVSDGKGDPITDLKQADFEITENGRPQDISQFRLIRVDGNPRPGLPPPMQIRNRMDEEVEAARDDVRIFGILLDDYHVRRGNSISVRTPLTQFVQTQLRPNDLVAIMYPLTPVGDLLFTRNHEQIVNAIQRFEGRKFDYRPLNIIEQQYMRYPTEVIERIRNDVSLGALRGLAVRLGSMRDGRKSIVYVSEGLTAMLPPQMRRGDASAPDNPIQTAIAAGQQDSAQQMTAEWFGMADVMQRMRDVTDVANRQNAAIYSLDPRGLAVFEYDIDDGGGQPPSMAADSRALRLTQDTLRILSEETDGRAIVNRNTLAQGMAQIVRDSSFYYLLGYMTTQKANDGKFHEIDVRVKRRGVQVRARKGYWAMTETDVQRAANPTPELARPVQTALASISTNLLAARYVRTWVGTERGSAGKTRVTLVWEPLPAGARREPPGRVALIAADGNGNLLFRGRQPEAIPATAPTSGQRLVFEAPPGKVELRMTIEAAGAGGTLDTESRTIEVPDLTRPEAAISTPRVFRARTAREMQALVGDAEAVPAATREFARTERLLIRFHTYGAGTDAPAATAVLLNRAGQKISDLPVASAPVGGTHQVEVGLASIPAGEYLIEIAASGPSGEVKELVPMRVVG